MLMQKNVFSFIVSVIVSVEYFSACDGYHSIPPSYYNLTRFKRQSVCREGEFACNNGQCIPNLSYCDGNSDCSDRSDEVLNCNRNGRQGCVTPKIENGILTVSGSIGSIIKESSVITIECNPGYKLSGNNLPKKVGDIWNVEIPTCVEANVSSALPVGEEECSPPVIKNGKYTILGINNHVPGYLVPNFAILNFTCNCNYTLTTTNNLVYCINGQFESEIPKCVPSCAPRFSSSIDVTCELNGIVQNCSKKVPEGTIATMTCKTHYVEIYRGPSTALCAGGSWDVPIKQCSPDCGKIVPKGQFLIVNGIPMKKSEFPWHVAIYRETTKDPHRYICGGSIISVKVVLSAAHCFADLNNGKLQPISEFSVAAGKYFSNWDAPEDADFVQKRKVSKIEIPKNIYLGHESNYTGDIAVVVVVKPFVLTNLIKPVCVDWKSEFVDTQLRIGAFGQVTGWGANIPEDNKARNDLKQLSIPFIDRTQCLELVPQDFRAFLTFDKYCAGYTNSAAQIIFLTYSIDEGSMQW